MGMSTSKRTERASSTLWSFIWLRGGDGEGRGQGGGGDKEGEGMKTKKRERQPGRE